jgi:hypothetical protein
VRGLIRSRARRGRKEEHLWKQDKDKPGERGRRLKPKAAAYEREAITAEIPRAAEIPRVEEERATENCASSLAYPDEPVAGPLRRCRPLRGSSELARSPRQR